jgi:hypothetical protein
MLTMIPHCLDIRRNRISRKDSIYSIVNITHPTPLKTQPEAILKEKRGRGCEVPKAATSDISV